MPIGAPAAASSAIWLAAGLASGGVLKATGSGLSRTARVRAWLAVLPSEEVAVTVRLIDGWVLKSSVQATVVPASGSVAEAVIPMAAPAAASSAIWLAVGSASGWALKATGALSTARVKAWLAVLPSEEVAVT